MQLGFQAPLRAGYFARISVSIRTITGKSCATYEIYPRIYLTDRAPLRKDPPRKKNKL
jgi:hypothetical protein